VMISPVSCFEVALACKRGRIQLPCAAAEWIQEALEPAGIEIAPLTPVIACAATALGEIHKDPFDRIIIATAIHSHATLLSVDGHFEHYPELKGVLAEDGAGDRT
jgi:PIN domain nuclease of toxin-antitoxin system